MAREITPRLAAKAAILGAAVVALATPALAQRAPIQDSYDARGYVRVDKLLRPSKEDLKNDPCYGPYLKKDWDAMHAICYRELSGDNAPTAHYALSVVHRHGIGGFERNLTKSAFHLREASKGGLQNAMYVYANFLAQGLGVAPDRRLAVDILYESALGQSSGAMFYLGDLYMRGWGAPKNRMLALMWMHIAEANGMSERALKSYFLFLPSVLSEEELVMGKALAKAWILANPQAIKKNPPVGLDALPDLPADANIGPLAEPLKPILPARTNAESTNEG